MMLSACKSCMISVSSQFERELLMCHRERLNSKLASTHRDTDDKEMFEDYFMVCSNALHNGSKDAQLHAVLEKTYC